MPGRTAGRLIWTLVDAQQARRVLKASGREFDFVNLWEEGQEGACRQVVYSHCANSSLTINEINAFPSENLDN